MDIFVDALEKKLKGEVHAKLCVQESRKSSQHKKHCYNRMTDAKNAIMEASKWGVHELQFGNAGS